MLLLACGKAVFRDPADKELQLKAYLVDCKPLAGEVKP
jgi:hypothetical protein